VSPARPTPYRHQFASPVQRMLVRPTELGSLTGAIPTLDRPKPRVRRIQPKVGQPKTPRRIQPIRQAFGDPNNPDQTVVPKKSSAKKKRTTKSRPTNFGYVLEAAYSKQCNAWTQNLSEAEGTQRFYVNAPRAMRFKVSGMHGAYRTAYDLGNGTYEWIGCDNGFIDLRQIVEGGFYYCYDEKCEFQSCPMSYAGPRKKTTNKKKPKPVRGQGMLFAADGTGNKVTWSDEGEMVIEPVPPEFHTFTTVR
jgi:hypothetical protein